MLKYLDLRLRAEVFFLGEQALKYETKYRPPSRKIGETALWGAGALNKELGVNDPLTHLKQYLERGESAIGSIDEDLVTDVAERRLKPTFINPVKFDRVGSDFVSHENKFSMLQMTAITEYKFSGDGNVANLDLYKRAKIESEEVARLNQWFDSADTGDVFIVESMGMTPSEKYTIVRLHQKASPTELVEHVITLHNATVDIFNKLHNNLNAKVPDSRTKLELLDNMYAYKPDRDGFVEEYVAAYDGVLSAANLGKKYTFGLPKAERQNAGDDITAIRRQTRLRSVYLDNLRALGKSNGCVTPQILKMNRELGGDLQLVEGGRINFAIARELMDRSLQSICATLNRAPKEVLDKLASGQVNAGEAAGSYGGEARAEGTRYDGACPSGSAGAAAAEASALGHGHGFNKDPSRCGTCPNCSKQYFVPKEIYKDKILLCDGCNSAIHFDGSPLSAKELEKYTGKTEKPGFLEILSADFKKTSLQEDIKRLINPQKSEESDFERRRREQRLIECQLELEILRETT